MTKVFNEILGKHVEIPEQPQRIVSLAPALTETLFLLGLEDKIAAVSHFCNKPPKAREKPRIGSYFKVNYKKLDEINPDLVLVTTGAQRRLALELDEKGYPVYPVPLPVSLYGILENIIIIGHVTNRTSEARRLVNKLSQHLSHTLGALEGLRVYYEIWLGGPVSAGRFSYISHALSHLGLRNCMDSHEEPWVINPDPDEVFKCDPDIFVYEIPPYSEKIINQIIKSLEHRELTKLPTIRNRGLILLPPDSLAHYGPSITQTLEDLALTVRGKRPVHTKVEVMKIE